MLLLEQYLTMSYVPLARVEVGITLGSLSWRVSEHFINPLVKYFGGWSTNLQKMSPVSGKPVELA